MKHLRPTTLAIAVLGSVAATPTFAQSAYLPAAGEFTLTPGYSFATYDVFRVGTTRVKALRANNASFDQHSGYLSAEYGLFENLALDVTLGYTHASSGNFRFGPGARTSTDGLTDTLIGLRYRLVDESKSETPYIPTITLRAGVIIEGTYDVIFDAPVNAGDGASGVEISAAWAKEIGGSGFGLQGDFGFRHRAEGVPEDLFGSAGIFQRIGPVTLTAGYRHVQGLSGGDIGGPGFGTVYGFPQVREIVQLVEAGVAFTDGGGRSYSVAAGTFVGGRNTGERFYLSAGISIPFYFRR